MSRVIKTFVAFIIPAVAAGALLLSPLDAAASREPVAQRGIIDLGGYDPGTEGPIELAGEWEYFSGIFIRSEDDYRKAVRSGYTTLPGLWDAFPRGDGAPGGAWHGSLVLTVKLKDTSIPLAIGLGEVKSSYELYAGGIRLGGVGRVGATAAEAQPGWRSAVYPLPPSTGDIRFVMNVANFHYVRGGARRAPLLGTVTAVMHARDAGRFAGMFLFGSIFIMSLYQLALFLSRRDDRAPLAFAAFCLLISVYLLTTGEILVLHIIPNLPWGVLVAAIYLSLYLCPVFFLRYLEELFPGEMRRRFRIVMSVIFLLLAASVIALPPRIYSFTLAIFHGVIAIVSFVSFLAVVRAVRMRRDGAIPLLTGISLFVIAIINDIFYYEGLFNTGDAAPAGVFLLILTHGFAVSRRHVRTSRARDERIGEAAITPERRAQLDWAVEFIRAHYTESISREELAARINLHPDTFGRMFRQHTGKKIGEMINALRIEKARNELAGTARTVLDIAMGVGFENLRTFNRVFKEMEGVSPLEYRKKHPDNF